MKWVLSKVASAEDSVKSISKIEKDLSEISDFLNKESEHVMEKVKISEKTVDDSGISDGCGEILHNVDILEKEENLKHLSVCVQEISKTISPKSPAILGINTALVESTRQLKSLKEHLNKHKSLENLPTIQPNKPSTTTATVRPVSFWLRVKKFVRFFTILLSILILCLAMINPTCCEFRNTLWLRLSYVNGPP